MNLVRASMGLLVGVALVAACSKETPKSSPGQFASAKSALSGPPTPTAPPAVQVKDFEAAAAGNPAGFVSVGSNAYFVATTAANGTELWKTDGTTAGTVIAADLNTGAGSSSPSQLTAVGSNLYFVADDGTNGLSLFVFDGTSATRLAAVPAATKLFAAGASLYFIGTDATNGDELWSTAGAVVSTALVKDINPGAGGSSIGSFAAIGTTVFFAADNGTDGVELWSTDGTAAATTMLSDINAAGSSNPTSLTSVGSNVYFAADDGTHGVELWKASTTAASIVAEIVVGATGAAPAKLTAVGSKLYFEADDGANGAELWVVDTGAASPTASLVKNINAAAGASLSSLTAGNGVLFFAADDGTNGLELWKTDGTTAGTALLKDINPGAGSGLESGATFTFLPTEGVLVFAANDGTSGNELWKSDGAAMGTKRVADITAGTGSSSPSGLTRAGASVFFSADESTTGRELWLVPVSALAVPSIVCGSDVMIEATGSATTVTYTAAQASDGAGAPTVTYSKASGDTFPVGVTTVTATATNSLTATATCTLKVTVTDSVKPTIECPPDFTVQASSTGGAKLNSLPQATSTDNASVPTVTYNPAAGSFFPLGTTFVIAKATDGAGNFVSCGFTILVVDTQPPVLTCPTDQTIEANGPTGATNPTVNLPTHRDIASNYTVTYTPPLTGTFPLGQTTTVAVRAEDDYTNFSTCSFKLTVQDKTAPVLSCSSDFTVEADAPTGSVVSYTTATATDAVTVAPVITYSVASGTTFPIGTTTVVVQTQDDAGNKPSPCRFKVTVKDTVAPTIACPANVTAEANSIKGAIVQYAPATATDSASTPTITYTQAPGSTFAPGTTTVTATAKDGGGNTNTCTFTVTVNDTQNPTITCPPDVHAQATGTGASYLRLPNAQASDLGSIPTITYSPSLSAAYPMGTTLVTATAKDGVGNTASCTFNVTVADTQPPSLTCPAEVVAEATAGTGALVSYPAVSATDSVSAVSLNYSVASGSQFPVGVTNVTVTAEDQAGNELGCTFPVRVTDSVPPTISCPPNATAEANSPEGATVTYADATATDTVSAPKITYSHPSGMAFPLGQTVVSATAADFAGNVSACTFAVNVKDTTAPTISCPADVTAEATSANGALVKYPAPTVSDSVTVTPFVEADHASGSRFPIGATVVTLTASDSTGNHASCLFNVVVRDSQGPALTCPADVTLEATSNRGALVTFGLPTPVDAVSSSVAVSSDHESGSVFPVGTTTVKLTSKDAAENEGSCEFTVTVNPQPAEGGCSSAAPTGWALLLALAAGWRMRRRQRRATTDLK